MTWRVCARRFSGRNGRVIVQLQRSGPDGGVVSGDAAAAGQMPLRRRSE